MLNRRMRPGSKVCGDRVVPDPLSPILAHRIARHSAERIAHGPHLFRRTRESQGAVGASKFKPVHRVWVARRRMGVRRHRPNSPERAGGRGVAGHLFGVARVLQADVQAVPQTDGRLRKGGEENSLRERAWADPGKHLRASGQSRPQGVPHMPEGRFSRTVREKEARTRRADPY